ncbi:MAG: hypothetical protein COU63_03740 [Candidatus Pacebacteria bacterium CG10_big_fil_rev_8_21_14_0_10_36_11]|nr:ATP-dependent DNA ligase [Candidatus Pacearchaeota archaeon]OIP73863.1 MAG: hypothetical protein AUK08_04890 [Candidatus Pacebacteria bacterium CG2_30_36_39]PIR64574.1 MAG: hypothetical protein COU63_03740 [Candidatus Pacebacteria bacterium CG10_big_fil_rev_8_21_14_0_10_36_11]PJC42997.1 MAG: hypothetical protein CO040_01500 [Candidatus Pacebacteria bacterium CG_4_9_14_0_2_um_filter_36_8]
MLITDFSLYLQKLEKTPSRLEMTEQLARLFNQLNFEEIPLSIYLLLGRLTPEYLSLEFQLSSKMVLRVLVQQMVQNPEKFGDGLPVSNLFSEADDGLYEKKVDEIYKKTGDIGETTQQVFANTNTQREIKLSLLETFEALKKIALEGGAGSQDRKVSQLLKLMQQVDALSARFIARMVIGKLRLGFSTMTIIDALSWVKRGDKSDASFLEELFQRKADLGILAQMYLKGTKSNDELMAKYQASLGIPVIPALCQRLNSTHEIIEKMQTVIAEPKYDGLRIQIHVDKETKLVRSFTRNLEETSHMFPELKRALSELNCKSCILDGEIVGIDKVTGEILPFQETSTRRRKHGVDEKAAEIPAHFYVFDVLEKDGRSLLDEPLNYRKDLLRQITNGAEIFIPTPYIITSDPQELKEFHEEQLVQGLEGAVMKKQDSLYKSGRKGWRWVKIKEEEGSQGKLNDTLDCVVMGYYKGKGKRVDFGLGAFLVGVVADNGEILTVAKVGTGLTDVQFGEFKKRTDSLIVKNKPQAYLVHKNLVPDVWVEPSLIVEIAADEITKSPIHSAGKALRFPRLVRFRDDKNVIQATQQSELETITHLV